MSDKSDTYSILKNYDLSDEEVKMYIFLLQHGFSTALQISRSLHLARTKVYRLIDKLTTKGLVEQRLEDRGMQFGATTPQRFEQLVKEKERELTQLKETLPEMITHLHTLSQSNPTQSKVLYYSGLSGLKQVNFNLTRAKDLLRVYEVDHVSDYLPKDFSEDLRKKFVEKKITTHDLTNKKSFGDFTKVTEMIEKYNQFRYIDPTLLDIKFEALIYNDVYATYTYTGDQIFCVEIYNEQLANMQKQIYDFIWNQAKKMKFISPNGKSVLM